MAQSLQYATLLFNAYEHGCIQPDDKADQGIDSTEKLFSTSFSLSWVKTALKQLHHQNDGRLYKVTWEQEQLAP